MSSDNTGMPNAGREQKSGVCNLALIVPSLTVSAGAGVTAGDPHTLRPAGQVGTRMGSLVAWGGEGSWDKGQTKVPGGNDYVAVAAGTYHSLALRADGTLAAWGYCDSGACACPPGNDYIAIAAGTYHSLVIVTTDLPTCERKTVVEYVIVANPGNPDDIHADHQGNSYGGVPYVYCIGKYEVTAAQYCAFLNAVAADDPHNLYDPAMAGGQTQWDSGCRIERHGQPGAYTYRVAPDWADRPVNFVNFWDACRFANWLHHGMPAGPQDANSTEDGAYTLNGYTGPDGRQIARRPGARAWVPSADEWYKAAYHKNDGATGHYWDYPTGTDVQPSNRLKDPDPGNNANFGICQKNDYTLGPPYWRTKAGEFENSASPYGTCDQAGNIREWTDSPAGVNDPDRIQHGSSYLSNLENRAGEMGRHASRPDAGNMSVGFRMAAERLKGDLGRRNGQSDGAVDFVDFAVLASAWMAGPNDDRS